MQGRLFVALELPEDVREALMDLASGVPGAYWVEEDQLHLTVRFLGRLDGRKAQDFAAALRRLELEPFELTLSGLGVFPPRGEPESLWVGVDKSEPLEHLRQRVDSLATRMGIEPDRRRYTPHVTLARLVDVAESRLGHYIAGNALWRSRHFEVTSLTLFSSRDLDIGTEYQREEVFLMRR